MLFKTICITMPEKMIHDVDDILAEGNFSSRSEFFRFLLRMFVASEKSYKNKEGYAEVDEPTDPFAGFDFEFGMPPQAIEILKRLPKK